MEDLTLPENTTKDIATDSIATGRYTIPTGVYEFKIKAAFKVDSQSSKSQGITLELENTEGRSISLTSYYRGRDGKLTTVAKWGKNTGKTVRTFGYQQLDDICEQAIEVPLAEAVKSIEKKTIKLFGENQEVDMVMDLLGSSITMAIQERRVNKTTQVGKDWVDTAEEKFENILDKVLTSDHLTMDEVAKKESEAKFIPDEWLPEYEGVIQDKYKEVKVKVEGTAGVPTASVADDEL